ncbi:PH domain-containing protein [Myroides sp. LJL119]
MTTKFNSEKSIYYLAVILIIPIAIIFYAIVNDINIMFISLIMLLITVINLYLFFFTHFIVNKNNLILKIGLFTYKKINLKDIIAIKDENSLRKGLSASMKNRIEIFYGQSSIIISPKNKTEFLKIINSHLK